MNVATDLSTRPKQSLGRARVTAAVIALVVIGGGAIAGTIAVSGAVIPGEAGIRAGVSGATGFGDTFVGVLSLNLPVAASLAAGILSAGLFTVVSGLLLGLYLGATMAAAINTVGAGDLIGSVATYVGVEMLGLLAAALGGLLPLATAIAGPRNPGQGALRRYAAGIAPAGVLVLVGVGLLIVGAAIESAVIAGVGPIGEAP